MYKPAFKPGDKVEWSQHQKRPRGIVLKIVDHHFHEVELLDPPPGQAAVVRLIAGPLTEVEDVICYDETAVVKCSNCTNMSVMWRNWFLYHTAKTCSCGGRLSQHHEN